MTRSTGHELVPVQPLREEIGSYTALDYGGTLNVDRGYYSGDPLLGPHRRVSALGIVAVVGLGPVGFHLLTAHLRDFLAGRTPSARRTSVQTRLAGVPLDGEVHEAAVFQVASTGRAAVHMDERLLGSGVPNPEHEESLARLESMKIYVEEDVRAGVDCLVGWLHNPRNPDLSQVPEIGLVAASLLVPREGQDVQGFNFFEQRTRPQHL